MIDASPVAAADTREVRDLQSACARTDIWGLSEVAKALCGAVGTCINSQGRPVCFCARCAPGAGGSIACALSGKRVRVRVRLNRVRFQHLRPVSSLSDSSGKTGIVHCRRINSQSKEERKQWKSIKTIQQLFSSYSEKRLESQCHLKGEIEQGSIPTLTTGFVLVGLIRQDWNRSLQENQFSIERREKAESS